MVFEQTKFFSCLIITCVDYFSDTGHWYTGIEVPFLPEASFGLRVLSSPLSVYLSVCVCMCVCINHLLVRTITHQPFKLKSPNLKHRCKTPWLRCLLFWGVIDLELQGQIEHESRILPHFELVRTITCHPFKLESPNLDKKCILVQLRCLLV